VKKSVCTPERSCVGSSSDGITVGINNNADRDGRAI